MTTAEILQAACGLSALVIGDICLDRWCEYDPTKSEPSAETGIPRLAVVSYTSTPGAGGTVAKNLAALGVGRVNVLGIAGEDAYGHELLQALHAGRIDSKLMVRSNRINTFTYTKLTNSQTGIEDQPRVDYINVVDPPEELDREVAARVTRYAPEFDLVLVSDQAETESGGVVSPRVRDSLVQVAKRHPGKLLWVDSRRRLECFPHLTLKANESEARSACERIGANGDYLALRGRTQAPNLFVTLGPDGALAISEEVRRIPARSTVAPVDICGAGDSFSAGASLALATTGDPVRAAEFGNLAASITILQRGTGAARADLMLAAAQ